MKAVLVGLLAGTSVALALTQPAPFVLTSPQDYQVFQRQTKTEGRIVVAGRLEKGGTVEVRLDDRSWQQVPVQAKLFRVELAASARGWHKVIVRAAGEERVLEHVGVGEVFIVAGQSNSANHGSEKQKTETGLVAAFDGTQWGLAVDPQRGASGKGGSFMPAFGDALAKRLGMPVAVVPCGIGATSVRQWLPQGARMDKPPTTGGCKQVGPNLWESGGGAFATLMKRVTALGTNGFRAILWHQGESDCHQAPDREITPAQYHDFMVQLIRASREQAGWPVPWFVAQVSYHNEKAPAEAGLRAAQAALWKEGFALAGPDSDSLRGTYRAGIHFNGKGLQAHGKLWAEKVGPWVEQAKTP